MPDGRKTVLHLSATGGTPPYRFYVVPTAGGEGAPSWFRLAPDGTVTVEPPEGVSAHLSLSVQVIDANGERSEPCAP